MRFKNNLRFYLLRLRNSSIQELIFRTRQALVPFCLRVNATLNLSPFKTPYINCEYFQNLKLPELIVSDDKALTRTVSYLLSELAQIVQFDNGCNSDINGSDLGSEQPEDIRMTWEPARLQAATLLLVYAFRFHTSAAEQSSKSAAKAIVFEWISRYPFPRGIHYISAMECALRIPVFFYTLKLLNDLTENEKQLLINAIFQHAWLISRRLSLYSSRGNHTIAESVGLVFAGILFRSCSEGNAWLSTGIKLLARELPLQVLEDGGPAEQSFNYHRFVLDLYWLAADFLNQNGISDAEGWRKRLLVGESFLSTFQDCNSRLPSIGDSDGGHAIAPGVTPRRGKPNSEYSTKNVFPTSGYTVIRNREIIFTFDHGSLGMAPFCNHGHADALSITLTKNDKKVLVDPGTYRYNNVPEWRRYFKGTRAHNTVTIDHRDQARQETSFIWSRPYKAMPIVFPSDTISSDHTIFLQALHNGYSEKRFPFQHQRSILFFGNKNLLIKDCFKGVGCHHFELNFHFHPDISLHREQQWWVAESELSPLLYISFHSGGDITLLKGENDPVFGWYSPAYGEKEPASVLSCSKTGMADTTYFLSFIYTEPPPDSETLRKRIIELEKQA